MTSLLEFLNTTPGGIVLSVLSAAALWLWRKARGERQKDLTELLDEVITAEVNDALADNATLGQLEERLIGAAEKLSKKAKLKIPRTVIQLAVQWGVVEFRRKMQERAVREKAAAGLAAQVDALAAEAAKVGAAFTPPANPTVPPLAVDVEVVQP